jgi:hypothetical protein
MADPVTQMQIDLGAELWQSIAEDWNSKYQSVNEGRFTCRLQPAQSRSRRT